MLVVRSAHPNTRYRSHFTKPGDVRRQVIRRNLKAYVCGQEDRVIGISLKTQKMLWGRAANRCAFPDCHRELVMDVSETDEESLIGEACHMVAREPSGPRGNSSLPIEQRDKYDNLILLCRVHHKLVDDQPNTYTVQRLVEMKATHEKWVRESLQEFDAAKQYDDELYAAYVEEWVKRADLDNWLAWSSNVLGSGQPHMSTARDKEIEELRTWLFSRIWPKRYPKLEAAFENFRRVLQDFQETFHQHTIKVGMKGEALWTKKFYQIDDWDPPRYKQLARQFDFHVALVEDLMLELTRTANYICDWIRQFISPMFRLHEGLVLAESGPYMDMTFKEHRLEYRGEERVLYPYPGLDQFKRDRKNRDLHFGEGISADDPEFRVGGDE